MSNEVAGTIGELIRRMEPQIRKALPAHVTPDRMCRIVLTALRLNPKLAQCNQASLMGAVMTGVQLGLELNTPLGEAYLIPYGRDVTFQLGYKGLIALAYRSGAYSKIQARSVDMADEFSFCYGLDEDMKHIPADIPSGEISHFYAYYKLKNGETSFTVWSKSKAAAHGEKYSPSYKKDISPWKTAFEQMAQKTVLKDLLRYAPKSIELHKGINSDHAVIKASFDSSDFEPDIVFPMTPLTDKTEKKEEKKNGVQGKD